MTLSNAIVRSLLSLLAVVFLGGAAAAAAPPDDGEIGAIVVRFRDDLLPGRRSVLPEHLRNTISDAMQTAVSPPEPLRDGAVRLRLQSPLPVEIARERINRIRLDPAVVYANFDRVAAVSMPAGPAGRASGIATNRLIVKYADPSRVTLALAGVAPDKVELDRLSTLAGRPLAFLRVMHDGAQVLLMMQRQPIEAAEAMAAAIAAQPDIEFAQPDYIKTAQLVPTDPCYASASVSACSGNFQWDLFDPVGGVNAPAAWDITTGSSAIRIGVIDTGYLGGHPDLAGRFVGGYDFIDDQVDANDNDPVLPPCTPSGNTGCFGSRDGNPADPGDWITSADDAGTTFGGWLATCGVSNSSFHGTHVAGTIGAVPNNGIGIAGLNWTSLIVPARVLGKCGGYTSDIADAIVWESGGAVSGVPANANPVRVMNLSLGGSLGSGTCPVNDNATQNAVTTALANGAVVVVSAGNNNLDASNYSPASCNGVVTVAATTTNGGRAGYSNYGTTVEIAAPGGSATANDGTFRPSILSTLNNGAQSPNLTTGWIYANYAGTSMAAPHVTGIISLMFSVRPTLTPAQALSIVQSTARAFPTNTAGNCTSNAGSVTATVKYCGAGIVNAGAAVAAAQSAGATTTTTLASSANPSVAGNAITLTATVTGSAPTGSVAFKDGGMTITNCGTVALAGSGNSRQAQCVTPALVAGSYSLTAAYAGDPGNGASTSSVLGQVVNRATALAGLGTSGSPIPFGSPVIFTATISGYLPTGSVAFTSDGVSIGGCGAIALTGTGNLRTALCTTSTLAVSATPQAIVVSYAGDANNTPAASPPLAQAVTKAPTTTSLASSLTPSVAGASITFTATVTGVSPGGAVLFTSDAATIPACAAVALAGPANNRTAQCTTAALAVGTHSVSAVYGGDATNAGSTASTLSQVVKNLAKVQGRDFNGDGRGDLLWHHAASGETLMWLMNGGSITAAATLLVDPGWSVVKTGDFNGDGKTDLVWRNAATGEIVIWLMNGTSFAGGGTLTTDPNWTVTHVADFNGDGKDDLLWRNAATGAVMVSLMNGSTSIGGGTLLTNPAWTVSQVGDFDGDGRADLVWRNSATGATAMWLMNGAAFVSGAGLLTDPNWSVTNVGDFNGDGKADLIWRNSATGATAMWLMSGTAFVGGTGLLADPNWRVTHAADLDGDGMDDLVWRNVATGETAAWLMSGTTLLNGTRLLPGPDWSVVRLDDFNANATADVVWHNGATSETVIWLMNGTAPTAGYLLSNDPNWSVVP